MQAQKSTKCRLKERFSAFGCWAGDNSCSVGACTTAQRVYYAYLTQGQIVNKTDGQVVMCIGTKEGAKLGQTLTIVRIHEYSVVERGMRYERIPVGKIEITEIVEEHFAKARIIEGTADNNDIAELKLGK